MDEVPTGDVRCQLRLAVLRCPGHGQFSRGSFSSSIRFESAMIPDRIAVMRSIIKTRREDTSVTTIESERDVRRGRKAHLTSVQVHFNFSSAVPYNYLGFPEE